MKFKLFLIAWALIMIAGIYGIVWGLCNPVNMYTPLPSPPDKPQIPIVMQMPAPMQPIQPAEQPIVPDTPALPQLESKPIESLY